MTQDPYRIWVSEVMLQQTRAQAVIPFYETFLLRFPTVDALADAKERDLLACWSGLGYYSRARNLQKAARVIVSQYEGLFPRELEEALALPGIGTYTAAAVLSIAYGIPLPVVDGNVARVLSRLFAMGADVRTNGGKQTLLKLAGELHSARRPGDFNQAMMELGATICTPQQPQCPICPLGKYCLAFSRNEVAKYPPLRRKEKPVVRLFVAALIMDGKGKCLLVRRPQDSRWMGGFWELPMNEGFAPDHSLLISEAMSERGITLRTLLGRVRHTITTNKLEVSVFQASLVRVAQPRIEKWVSLRQINRLPVTTITRKALRLADQERLARKPTLEIH
jgi:A/G-specific adenine glycosylase